MHNLKTIFTIYLLVSASLIFGQTVNFTLFDTLNGRHYAYISSGDINNDSVPDFLFTGTTNGTQNVPVILGYSDTGFVTQTTFGGTHVESGDAGIRDMNQDNLVDVLYQGSGQKLRVYGQNSNGTFTSNFSDYGSPTPRGMDIGDYDNDGDLDVIVIGPHVSFQPLLHLYTNTGNSFVKSSPSNIAPRKEGDVAFGDFDGDYDLDLIVCGRDSNNIDHSYIYENANGTFVFKDSLPGSHYTNIEIHDINGDGLEDIIMAGRFSGNYAYTRPYINQGSFSFTYNNSPNPSISSDQGLSVGDIDSDGDLDFYTQRQSGNYFYFNDGTGKFSKGSTVFDSLAVGASTLLDFDYDGDLDLVTSGYSHTASVKEGYAYKNNSAILNTLPSPPTSGNYFWSGNDIVLTWNSGSDLETDSLGLTYNLFLVNTTTGQYIISPESDTATGYKFRNGRGNIGTVKGHLIKNLPSGSYIWGVQSVDNNFSGSTFFTQNISICQTQVAPSISILGNDSTCNTDSILLNISTLSGYTPVWHNANGAINASTNLYSYYSQPNNTVHAVFQDINGCLVNSDTVILTGVPKPSPVIFDNGINQGICPDDSIRLNILGNFNSIQWFNNGFQVSSTDYLWLNSPGNIKLVVTDSTGVCNSDTISTQIVGHTLSNIQFPTIQNICINADTLNLNVATPVGGNYYGNGITNNKFVANNAGTGSHDLYYSFTNSNGCVTIDTSSIFVDELSNAGILSGDTSICQGDSAILMVNGIIGQNVEWQILNGSWNSIPNSDTTQTISPSLPMQIRTIITNQSCPSDTSQIFNLQVDTLPHVQISPISNLCLDAGLSNLVANPIGGSFSGTGVSGSVFSPSIAGVGNFEIHYQFTDLNQCTNSDTISVQIDSLSYAGNISAPDSICLGESVNLSLTGNWGSQITWTETVQSSQGVIATNTGLVSVSPIQTTFYKVLVTNGACPADSSVHTLRVDTIPSVTIPMINTICQNQPIFNAMALPLGGIYYVDDIISTNSINPASLLASQHELKYEFTNAFGCSAKDSILFSVDSASVGGSFANDTFQICEGNSQMLTLSNQNGTILDWIFSIDSGQTWNSLTYTSPTFTHISNQTQNYRVITKNGVCAQDTSTVTTVAINSNPNIQFQNDTLCENEFITDLTVLTNLSGGFFTGLNVTGNTFTPTLNGVYVLQYTFTDLNGCVGMDSAEILVNVTPTVSYDSIFNTCTSDTIINLGTGTPSGGSFTGIGVNGVQWDGAISGTGGFEIMYTFTDSNSCSSSDTSNISINPEVIVNIGDTIFISDSILLDAGIFDHYLWNTGDTTQSIKISSPGLYSVMVSQNNGCSGSDSVRIFLTNAEELDLNLDLRIFPNPTSKNITINASDLVQLDKIRVRDLNGKQIIIHSVNSNEITFDVTYLSPGTYFMEFLKDNNVVLHKKLIVTH